MWSMRSATSSRNRTPCGTGWSTDTTRAVRQPPRGADGPPRPSGGSVTLVALLAPGVAAVVVAVLLPEPRAVPRAQRDPADPLGALPEVQVRHEHAHRPTVLDRQRPPVELPGDPRLAARHVGQRQVGRVTGAGRRHHELRLGGRPGDPQQRVDADAGEPGVEL